jgi:hypothetical protein
MPTDRSRALALAIVAVSMLVIVSCRRDDTATPERTGSSASASSASAQAGASSADSGSLGVHSAAELDEAAKQIIGFLRGDLGFDRVRLADTVTLYVSPEGGGTRAAIAREQLRDRSNWRGRGHGRAVYSFVPPKDLTKLTTRVGRHLKCLEYPLSSRFPELARLPHVGTKLEPVDASSCLQTRNLTLVFDPNQRPPTLVAAVYDQFEW